jgi:hypothetical protein
MPIGCNGAPTSRAPEARSDAELARRFALSSSTQARGITDVAGVTLCGPGPCNECASVPRKSAGIFNLMSRGGRDALCEEAMGCGVLVRRDGCCVHGGGDQRRRQKPRCRHRLLLCMQIGS